MQPKPDDLHARLEPLFQEDFERLGELGAAVSVWQNGKAIVDLYGGFRAARRKQPWTDDALVLIWSATKGLGTAGVLHVFQEEKNDNARRGTEFWPEFAQADKKTITIAQLLSHQAGLVALDRQVDVTDYASVIHALEEQAPLWPPGTAHGYHARTFGFLLDELVRRMTKTTLSEYWRRVFAEPLRLDIWIGLPESENHRVATVYAAKAGKPAEPKQFYVDLATPGTLARKAFTSPHGLHAISAMNDPANRARPIVSFGGIGNANSLAKFYAMLANGGELDGQKFFAEQSLHWMKTTLTDGIDRVFQIPTAFSAGFMKDSTSATRRIFARPTRLRAATAGQASSFGHPGAGGSHAFADLENKIAFAYVMNQMDQSVLPNEKSLRPGEAIYG